MRLKAIGTPEELEKARELLAAAKGIEYIEEKQMQESAEPPDIRQVLQLIKRNWPRSWQRMTYALCPFAFLPDIQMMDCEASNDDDICERCWRDAMEG